VLCDRFTDATYAYQGGGRRIAHQDIGILEELVQGSLRPDITLILDLDPAEGLRRAAERGALDRFEKEKLEFFQAVRATYLERARKDPSRCRVIDAGSPLDQVRSATLAVMESLLDS
jgi:dTMP kinase